MPEPKLVMREPKLGVLKKVAVNGEGALIRQRPPPADRAVSALPANVSFIRRSPYIPWPSGGLLG